MHILMTAGPDNTWFPENILFNKKTIDTVISMVAIWDNYVYVNYL